LKVEWQQLTMLSIQDVHAREKQLEMWCEARNSFLKMAVSLSMTLFLLYWLTSKSRIVLVCVRTFRKDFREIHNSPYDFFLFLKLKLVLSEEEFWCCFRDLRTIYGCTCRAKNGGFPEILPIMVGHLTHCIRL
jgi:hypothetical protein